MYNILICGTFRGVAFKERQEAEKFVKEMIADGENPENLEIFYNECQLGIDEVLYEKRVACNQGDMERSGL